MFAKPTLDRAAQALQLASAQALRIATAETCTAGLVSSCLTSVPGASKTFERGFVLYHDSAKATGLGVPEAVSRQHGAVSGEVTKGLAEGALGHSTAGVAVAVTGYAGPGGGNEKNPVGTVYVAAARKGADTMVERHVFSGDRDAVRMQAVDAALGLLVRQLSQ
ncbi:MAG: nicotinamide-nucleotide amidase [Alphaproteobacteria bacterium]|jgi:nicotinamide-nucleotide amidase|nr:nicotinamide-nucleotide amidase [Alphaproteobacteria bacterium]